MHVEFPPALGHSVSNQWARDNLSRSARALKAYLEVCEEDRGQAVTLEAVR